MARKGRSFAATITWKQTGAVLLILGALGIGALFLRSRIVVFAVAIVALGFGLLVLRGARDADRSDPERAPLSASWIATAVSGVVLALLITLVVSEPYPPGPLLTGSAVLFVVMTAAFIIVGFVLLVSVPVAVVGMGSGKSPVTVESSLPPAELMQSLALAVAQMPTYSIETPAPVTMAFVRLRRPAWTVVIAVLFFPLGLLALLVTYREVGTVVLTQRQDGGSTVRVRGYFAPKLLEQVREAVGPGPAVPQVVGSV